MSNSSSQKPADLASSPPPQWQKYWDCAQSHRETVTQIILDSASPNASICIWGAGTCHDLDLQRLAAYFRQVTLVDINSQDIKAGIEYQKLAIAKNLQILAPVDLAGTQHISPKAEATQTPTIKIRSTSLHTLIAQLRSHRIKSLDQYDMVVSTGILSQIIVDIAEATEITDTELKNTCVIARRRHLELMCEHINPQGIGLLVTDFLNSDDIPALITTENLQATVQDYINSNKNLVALAPQSLQHDLLTFPSLAKRVNQVACTDFWLWEMTQRHYACYALRFQKK